MTRKRFIKLLMAKGYSRNEANTAAKQCQTSRIEYRKAHTAIKACDVARIKFTTINIDAVCDAIRKIVDVVQKMAVAIGKAVTAFATVLTEEMEKSND